jgi:acetyl-CoA synthetase
MKQGRFRWWMVWLLIGPITFVMSLDRTAIVVAAPVIQQQYGFTLVEMSLILTSFSWTYAFLQVPAGWLAESIGPRRALFWANMLWSVLTALTALGFNLASFIAIRTLLGVGQSADWPASVLALRRWFPKRERAKGNSVLLGGLYLGPIIATPITTAVMLSFGWRFVFYGFGALGILLGFAWWFGFRDSPAEHPLVSHAEAALIAAETEAEAPATPGDALPMLFRSVQFWAVGLQYFFLILIQSFYTSWLPTYLVQARDFSLEPSLAFYAALFGAMKLGAIAVPLFTLFGPDGVRSRVEDCQPRLLLTSTEKAEVLGDVGVTVVAQGDTLTAAISRYPAQFTPSTRGDDLAIFQYTSGTTRELPQAVRHSHRAIVVVMVAALYGTGIRPGDRFFCPSSPAWGHGLWHGTLASLALGVETGVYAGRFDPERLLRALQDFGTTNLSAAATHYRMMRLCGAAQRYRYTLRKLSFTGEPIDSDSRAFAEQTFGTRLCSMYGTTEVGVILADYPGAEDFVGKPGALGKPVPGVRVTVQRPDGSCCEPGEVGEIKVWRHGAWFPTKDRGSFDSDGFYFHAGRADDVIISAGWTMSATEIEQVLLRHPAIRDAAAIGVPDAQRGQVVKAFVVTDQPHGDALAADIQQHVRSRLSQHEYPRIVSFVAELPKTPAGKVNRKALREREVQEQA